MAAWVIVLVLVLLPLRATAQTPTAPAAVGPTTAGQQAVLVPRPNFPSPLNPFPSTSQVQGTPSDAPFPSMPWWWGVQAPEVYGGVIGYRQVPAQLVTVELPVPSAETAPFLLQPQLVEIPGFVVAETANGFWYPERWAVEQLNVGVYQWRLLPAEYVRK
jgi:hypothetical protein